MNPIADLEALAQKVETTLRPDVLPYLWGHGSIKDTLEPIAAQLRAIIAEIKKRDEAVRKVAEEMASPDMAALASAAVQGMTTTASVIDMCAAWAARLREIVK